MKRLAEVQVGITRALHCLDEMEKAYRLGRGAEVDVAASQLRYALKYAARNIEAAQEPVKVAHVTKAAADLMEGDAVIDTAGDVRIISSAFLDFDYMRVVYESPRGGDDYHKLARVEMAD